MKIKALTTMDIEKALFKDFFTQKCFLGVFPRDEMPSIIFYPSCFIVNTEPSFKKGEHWLAMYFDKSRNCFFFDSFGHDPSFFNMSKYIKKYSSGIKYNKDCIQDNFSDTCGHYCVFFLLLINRGFSLDRIISFFNLKYFDLNDFNISFINK